MKDLNPEALGDLCEACNLFICNIGFVRTADEKSQNLLDVLTDKIEKAIAKAEYK